MTNMRLPASMLFVAAAAAVGPEDDDGLRLDVAVVEVLP